ncbi:MAG: hypothetical protein GVY36_16180 [Verrucomicrobia bacterium]|nr:hypothetical protein [Verrucomicrobiota bacterium]
MADSYQLEATTSKIRKSRCVSWDGSTNAALQVKNLFVEETIMKKAIFLGVSSIAVAAYFVAPVVLDKVAEAKIKQLNRETEVQAAQTDLQEEKEKTAKARMSAEGKAMCSASKAKIKDNPVAGADKGTKANLTLTSKVEADPGHFLLASSAKYSHGKGRSDKLRVKHKGKVTPIPKLAETAFSDNYVKSLSYQVHVWDHDWHPTTARGNANLSIQQYPMECLKYFVQDGLKVIDELSS